MLVGNRQDARLACFVHPNPTTKNLPAQAGGRTHPWASFSRIHPHACETETSCCRLDSKGERKLKQMRLGGKCACVRRKTDVPILPVVQSLGLQTWSPETGDRGLLSHSRMPRSATELTESRRPDLSSRDTVSMAWSAVEASKWPVDKVNGHCAQTFYPSP